jgi:hypothetical protein
MGTFGTGQHATRQIRQNPEERFGGVLFETKSEKVSTLGPAAAIREIRPGCDAAAIAARLKYRFQDPNGAIQGDMMALLGDLRRKGLLLEDAPA